MYDLIDAKRSTRKLYTEALIGRGDITMEEAEEALRHYQEQLERAFTETREATRQPTAPGAVIRQEPAAPAPWSIGAGSRVSASCCSRTSSRTPGPGRRPTVTARAIHPTPEPETGHPTPCRCAFLNSLPLFNYAQ